MDKILLYKQKHLKILLDTILLLFISSEKVLLLHITSFTPDKLQPHPFLRCLVVKFSLKVV